VVIARGDGIGPEITDAVLRILEHAGAALDVREIELGERGTAGGISPGWIREHARLATRPERFDVLQRVHAIGLDFIKLETLCTFDGEAGYSAGQGQ
jgi:hypothetical protein